MKKSSAFWLLFGFLLFTPFHFVGLDWATPNPLKSLLVFGSFEAISKLTPDLIASRTELYEHFSTALSAPASDVNAFWARRSVEDQLHPWQPIARPVVIGFMRGYLLGVPSDDQQTLAGLSHFKPWKGQWDTLNYTYGWLYQVLVAVSLAVGTAAGYLPHSFHLSDFLVNPEGVARLYVTARGLSAASLFLSAILLFRLARKDMPNGFAFFATALLLASPLALTQGHLAKPHALGMLFLLAAFQSARKLLDSETPERPLRQVCIAIGLASATAITNVLAFALIPVVLKLSKSGNKLSTPVIEKSLGMGAATAVVLNPFVFLSPGRFFRRITYDNVHLFGAGKLNGAESVFFIKTFFTHALPVILIPLLAWGIYTILENRNRMGELVVILASLYLTVDAIWMRHPGVGLLGVPLCAWIAAYGASLLWERFRSGLARMALGLLLASPVSALLYQDGVLMTRFARSGNSMETGAWINTHLPRGTSIGILAGNLSPAVVPPFRFLNYRLITVPLDPRRWKDEYLPTYLILPEPYDSRPLQEALATFYRLLYHQDERPPRPPSPYLGTHENIAMTVWERKPHD